MKTVLWPRRGNVPLTPSARRPAAADDGAVEAATGEAATWISLYRLGDP